MLTLFNILNKKAKLRVAVKAVLFLSLIFLSACSMYPMKIRGAKLALSKGNFSKALEELKPEAFKEGDDQLVYLLDYAMVLQYAGRLKESNQAFELAGKISEIKDYHSIGRIAGSLLGSQSFVQYKGENFEKVLINAFSAINYLVLNDLESGLVEARRLNEKLQKFKSEGGKKYEQNAFARYISAIAWEQDRKYDDAYIDYEKTYNLNKEFKLIGNDLIRLADLSDRRSDFKKWQKTFPEAYKNYLVEKEEKTKEKTGELIVIYQQGWSPIKRPHPNWPRIAKLFRQPAYTTRAKVFINGLEKGIAAPIFSVQDVAIKTMDEDYAGLIAKRIAAKVVKHKVANEVSKKNKGLGQLALFVMSAVDQADLRQWMTLPAEIHLARITLPEGNYQLGLKGLSSVGVASGESMPEKEIQITSGEKTFINWRSFR